jgi:hypothetical protein
LDVTAIEIGDVQIEVKFDALHLSGFFDFLEPLHFGLELREYIVIDENLETENFAGLTTRLVDLVGETRCAALLLAGPDSLGKYVKGDDGRGTLLPLLIAGYASPWGLRLGAAGL